MTRQEEAARRATKVVKVNSPVLWLVSSTTVGRVNSWDLSIMFIDESRFSFEAMSVTRTTNNSKRAAVFIQRRVQGGVAAEKFESSRGVNRLHCQVTKNTQAQHKAS